MNPLPALFLVAPPIYGDTAPPPPTQEISHPFSQGAAEAVRPKMQTGFRLLLPLPPLLFPSPVKTLKVPPTFYFSQSGAARSHSRQGQVSRSQEKSASQKSKVGEKNFFPLQKICCGNLPTLKTRQIFSTRIPMTWGITLSILFTLLRAAFFSPRKWAAAQKNPRAALALPPSFAK